MLQFLTCQDGLIYPQGGGMDLQNTDISWNFVTHCKENIAIVTHAAHQQAEHTHTDKLSQRDREREGGGERERKRERER